MEHYIGDPQDQIPDWHHQELPNDCAVVAQMSIINQYVDHPITETQAVYDSMVNGWMTTGGTDPSDVGNLLDLYGIPNHRVEGASVDQLIQELQAGHRVVVGVNSGELWDSGPMADLQNWLKDQLGLNGGAFNSADHAVDVIGVDVSDPAHPMVVLNDSGTPDGAGAEYPLDKFVDAWHGSDCFYVATDSAPPGGGRVDFDIFKYLGLSAPAATDAGQALVASADVLTGNLINGFDWDDLLKAI